MSYFCTQKPKDNPKVRINGAIWYSLMDWAEYWYDFNNFDTET